MTRKKVPGGCTRITQMHADQKKESRAKAPRRKGSSVDQDEREGCSLTEASRVRANLIRVFRASGVRACPKGDPRAACIAFIRVFRGQPVTRVRRYSSRCTVPGEKAGRQTAMYSAPSSSGELYWTHSPEYTMIAWPARTSVTPSRDVTRSNPNSTTVY